MSGTSVQQTNTLFVTVNRSKFPDYINSGHLRDHFFEFEEDIVSAIIVRDLSTKKSKGYGFVKFSSSAIASDALAKLRGSKLRGKFPLYIGPGYRKQKDKKDQSFKRATSSLSTYGETDYSSDALSIADSSYSLSTASNVQWFYEDDTGGYTPYTHADSDKIEQMYNQQLLTENVTIGVWAYTFDFRNMEQINTTTKRRRSIKRKVVVSSVARSTSLLNDRRRPRSRIGGTASSKLDSPSVMESVDVPSQLATASTFQHEFECIIHKHKCVDIHKASNKKHILFQGEKHRVLTALTELQSAMIRLLAEESQYPEEWEPQVETCEVFRVKEHTSEWRRVSSKFKETMPNNEITSIKRVQNTLLWAKYETIKKFKVKNGRSVNEMNLFHGSWKVSVDIIVHSEEGFDSRFSSPGMWGQANYFAVNASYSDKYAYRCPDGRTKEMLLAKVIIGDSIELPSDTSLRMPPEKTSTVSSTGVALKQVRYDTVNGITNGSRVYMTYSNERAYPAYIITYVT